MTSPITRPRSPRRRDRRRARNRRPRSPRRRRPAASRAANSHGSASANAKSSVDAARRKQRRPTAACGGRCDPRPPPIGTDDGEHRDAERGEQQPDHGRRRAEPAAQIGQDRHRDRVGERCRRRPRSVTSDDARGARSAAPATITRRRRSAPLQHQAAERRHASGGSTARSRARQSARLSTPPPLPTLLPPNSALSLLSSSA